MNEKRVGFGPRLGAYVIDGVLVVVLCLILGSVIGGLVGAGSGSDAGSAAVGGIMGMLAGVMLAVPVLGTIYFLIEGLFGFTLGKLILGLRVANADGSKGSIGLYLTRYAVKNISYILGLLSALLSISFIGTLGNIGALVIFIGCFFVLGASKQAFHDKIAKSAIFKKADIS